ncbi:polysaccharide deacetylase family protein [Rhizobium laguerreae]|uniref:polysaccharide deacetylase family protein n=1 Tax=Rhizobium laguerreae TaxID=1076926 RepID=UPI0035E3FCB8
MTAPDINPKLLDLLKCHRAKATFFKTAANIQAYPNPTRRISAEGMRSAPHVIPR